MENFLGYCLAASLFLRCISVRRIVSQACANDRRAGISGDRVDWHGGLGCVPDLEYTALKMLIEAEKRQRERGVSIWLVGLNPEVLSVIQRSSLGKVLARAEAL